MQAAEAAAALQALLATKRARLPPEPADGLPGSLQIMVRMPSGSRKARRFRSTDPLQALFDFVDVECDAAAAAAAAGGSGSSEGVCGVRPGSYRLVSQFPRQVFVEGGSSLQAPDCRHMRGH
jgi:hypothetical protein